MERSEIQKEIVSFVCENFLVEVGEFDIESSLIDQGVIDSFGLVEIASYLKKKFSIVTGEGEMNRENFGSIPKMAAYVERKKLAG